MSRRSCRRRVGTIYSKAPTIEVCGLQDQHLQSWIDACDSDSGADFSDNESDYVRDDSSERIYPAVEEILPYPQSVTRLVKSRHYNVVKPETLPEIDVSSIYRGSLLNAATNASERQIGVNIVEIFNDLESKSGSVDTWLNFRASLIYRCMNVFWANSRKDYREEGFLNSVVLFDRIIVNCVNLYKNNMVVPYHVTQLPVYIDTGLAREEITSLMCGCIHLSNKLANARHISSRLLANEFDTVENTVHLYEIIILKNTQCNIQICTTINIAHHWLAAKHLEPYMETIKYMADLILIMATYTHTYYEERTDMMAYAAIHAAETLYNTYHCETDIADIETYKVRRISPAIDDTTQLIVEQLLTSLREHSHMDRVSPALVDKADHVAASILGLYMQKGTHKQDITF